ncbi:beta-lactamase family protein [Quatrionicoccus australiensis]|nr:beta-lactamase family protein [Quatrionicoccus australiensis]
MPALVSLAREEGVPGFQVAHLSEDGHLSRCAVGWASAEMPVEQMQLEHRMSYASLSKIFTSTVVLQLVEEQRLALSGFLLDYLPQNFSKFRDERIKWITIAQLLSHRAGFDRSLTPDPMQQKHSWCPGDLSYLDRVQLDFDPGMSFAYANVGYCLLGAVVENLEQMPMEEVVRRRVLGSEGRGRFFLVPYGKKEKGYVKPHFDEGESLGDLEQLPWNSMVATGAWSGSASDLVNVLGKTSSHVQGRENAVWYSLRGPDRCDARRWRACHGLAFYRYQREGRSDMFWRDGSLPGATAFAAVFDSGEKLVFLGNYRKADWKPFNDRLGLFFAEQL